jgi:ribosomal-protein-alanine N-acetyltransferase
MIETERLILRPFVEDDFETLCKLRSDPEVMKYMGGDEFRKPEKIKERFRHYIEHQKKYGYAVWAAILKETNEMIGTAGLQHLDNGEEIEVGYGFDKPFWGKGYATEAARALLHYGFETLGLEKIVAVAIPENIPSRHVMEKLGMKYVKNTMHYGNECVYYSITKDEFAKSFEYSL